MTTDSRDRRLAHERAVQEVAPKWGELHANVLLGDVWERPGLSKRDRCLITVAALIALYRGPALPAVINRALDNGITKEEIGEIITHLAFYAGWPTAANAIGIAKQVFDER